MSPDLRKKVDANRAARLARENATQQQVSAQVHFTSSFRRQCLTALCGSSSTTPTHKNLYGQTAQDHDLNDPFPPLPAPAHYSLNPLVSIRLLECNQTNSLSSHPADICIRKLGAQNAQWQPPRRDRQTRR